MDHVHLFFAKTLFRILCFSVTTVRFTEVLVYPISAVAHIVHSSGRKHALRKTSHVPNHICQAAAVYIRRKLTFTAIFSIRLTSLRRILHPEKRLRDERYK